MFTSHTKEYRTEYWKRYRKNYLPYIQKACIICGKNFKQTSGFQKRCNKCRFIKCRFCKKKFIPDCANYSKVFCSKDCYSMSIRGVYPKNLKGKRGIKPKTYHLRKRAKHGGAKYKEWRMEVWKRDKFICQNCMKSSNELKKEGIKICADHIKPYCNYPELRYEVLNGRTLCVPCHKLTETYGIKARNF